MKNENMLEGQFDAKTINMGGQLHLTEDGMRFVPNERTCVNANEDRRLEHAIAKSLQGAFLRTPSLDNLKKILSGSNNHNELIDSLESLFSILGFRSDGEHVKLLNAFDRNTLAIKDRFRFSSLMLMVYKKNGEFSLALTEAECCYALASELNDTVEMINAMTAIGLVMIALDHNDVDMQHRKIIAFAKEHSLENHLTWAYHNWASYKWTKGERQDALLLYDKESKLRESGDLKEFILHLGFMANKQESVNPNKALLLYQRFIELAEKTPNIVGADMVSESCYRVASIYLKLQKMTADYFAYAKKAYDIYNSLPGMEARAGWAAGLVSIACENLNNDKDAIKYENIRVELLRAYGGDRDTFKALLGDAFMSKSLDTLKDLEKTAISFSSIDVYLDWNIAYSFVLFESGSVDDAIYLNEYGIHCAELANDSHHNDDVLSTLYEQRSVYLLGVEKIIESNVALKKAISLRPTCGGALYWKLCNNSYVVGDLDTAKQNAIKLIELYPEYPGPYRILARIYYGAGAVDEAITTLVKGRDFTNDNDNINAEINELCDLKHGLIGLKQCKHFVGIKSFIKQYNLIAEPRGLLPEYRNLSSFYQGVITVTCEFIHQLQKTPPKFLSGFRKDTNEALDEGDFRDELERTASHSLKAVAGETNHGKGRADLVVRNAKAVLPEGAVFEFKVWGRNDYRDVLIQLGKYLTDFEPFGVVFMINKGKKSIVDKYRDDIILKNPSYVTGSYRKSPIKEDSNMIHFYSCHKLSDDKIVSVFHFIFNAL